VHVAKRVARAYPSCLDAHETHTTIGQMEGLKYSQQLGLHVMLFNRGPPKPFPKPTLSEIEHQMMEIECFPPHISRQKYHLRVLVRGKEGTADNDLASAFEERFQICKTPEYAPQIVEACELSGVTILHYVGLATSEIENAKRYAVMDAIFVIGPQSSTIWEHMKLYYNGDSGSIPLSREEYPTVISWLKKVMNAEGESGGSAFINKIVSSSFAEQIAKRSKPTESSSSSSSVPL